MTPIQNRALVLLSTILIVTNVFLYTADADAGSGDNSSYDPSNPEPASESLIAAKFGNHFYNKVQSLLAQNMTRNYSVLITIVEYEGDIVYTYEMNSDMLVDLLKTRHRAEDIEQIMPAENLAFVSARVPLDELKKVAGYDFVGRIYDVEIEPTEKRKLLGTEAYEIVWNEAPYTLHYNIQNAMIEEIKFHRDFREINIDISTIDTQSNGILQLTFPSEFVDQFFGQIHPRDGGGFGIILSNATSEGRLQRFDALEYTCDSLSIQVEFSPDTKTVSIVDTFGPAVIDPYPNTFGMHHLLLPLVIDEKVYLLDVATNAESCNFTLFKEEKKIHVDFSPKDSEEGYFMISIPHVILEGPYSVLIDGQPIDDFRLEKRLATDLANKSTTISFEYDDNIESIDIIGTKVIPEFSLTTMLITVIAIGSIVSISTMRRFAAKC